MNKKLIYLFIFVLVLSLSKDVFAGTDILCNVLTTINATLKKVGEVQNKISGKTREILSKKIALDEIKNKAEKLKEKAENLKEKAERVKAFAENAKEKKEELMAKYQELNALAEEQFTKANEAFAKGATIYAEYEKKFQEYKDEVQGLKSDINENISAENFYNKASSVLGSDVASSLGLENVSTAVKGAQSNIQVTPVSAPDKDISKLDVPEVTKVSSTSQADAISSAAKLADQTVSESQTVVLPSQADILKKSEVNVSTSDIMKGVADRKQQVIVPDKEIKTDVDIKDQLTGNANKSSILSNDKKATKAVLSESKKQPKAADNRMKFGVVKTSEKTKSINNTPDKAVAGRVKPDVNKVDANVVTPSSATTAKSTQLINKNEFNNTKSSVKLNKITAKEKANVR